MWRLQFPDYNEEEVLAVSDYNDKKYVEHIRYFEDKEGNMSVEDVLNQEFTKGKPGVQNMGVTSSVFWFKITIKNDSNRDIVSLVFDNSLLQSITLYRKVLTNVDAEKMGEFEVQMITKDQPFTQRINQYTLPEFHVVHPIGSTLTYYFKVETFTQMLIPIKIMTREHTRIDDYTNAIWQGLYFGIMFIMFFYNLFVYWSVRDRSYLYYIFYVLSVALVQLNVTGVGFKYLWPSLPEFEQIAVFIFPSMTALASVLFINVFLNLKKYAPNSKYVFRVILSLYLLILIFGLFVDKHTGYNLVNAVALPLALYMIFLAAYIFFIHKYRPAGFFLVSWSTFLIGIICFVMKDYGVLEYNKLTVSAIQIGSAIEVLLLSFALADKINILEAQNRANREAAFQATEKTARLISQQNEILEQRVKERTTELENSNTKLERTNEELGKTNKELQRTLKELKDAQSQLVESEKMASLGQLTAGIAHEINNPINFVTSNVSPLKRDIGILQNLIQELEQMIADSGMSIDEKIARVNKLKEDEDYEFLKTEIDFLLKGISEGASRTSEIVKGLRLFSRLDEDDVKLASLEEGLDSTITIINHMLNSRVEVVRDYNNIPSIECFPGKLNQVFLNMMSNAVHAIQERWGENNGGQLRIRTFADENNVYISIADNGSGMSEETKHKLFEPFFTTKEVGVGTGLGLSIAWKTIMKHNGTIEVQSTLGEGTAFTISLPKVHQPNNND